MSKRSSTKQRGPSLEALRDLLAFHDHGGVSLAARKLGEHQPVVTRRLQLFQKKTDQGENLLKRSGKKLELTDTGTAVIPAIRQLIDHYDRLLDYIRSNSATALALRIGCGTFSVSQYLPRVIACFQQLFPDVELLIRIERGRERVLGTAAGLFDVAIVTHTPKQIREALKDKGHAPSALKIEDLCSHRLAVIAHRESDTGRELEDYDANRPLPITALRKWELVGLDQDSGVRQQLEAACHPLGELYFSVEGGGWAAAREYARLKMGAAILPEALLIPDDRQTFVVRNLGKDFVLTDRLVYRKDQKNPAVKEAIAVLKHEANA